MVLNCLGVRLALHCPFASSNPALGADITISTGQELLSMNARLFDY